MGFLETIAEMSIGKFITLGVVLIIVVGSIVGMVIGTIAIRSGSESTPKPPRRTSRTRSLSFGIVILSVGMGIVTSAYWVSNPSIWGVGGITILFGGIGLIISYFVVSAVEKRQIEKEVFTDKVIEREESLRVPSENGDQI